MSDKAINALCIAGLAGIGGYIGYGYSILFAVNPLLGIALGAAYFVGLPMSAMEESQ